MCSCTHVHVLFLSILYEGSLREAEPLGDRNYTNNKKLYKKYVCYRDYASRNCGT